MIGRYAHVVERDLRRRRGTQAHLVFELRRYKAARRRRDEERRDTLRARVACAREHDVVVARAAVRHPRLRPVEHVRVAIARRARDQGGRVGAAARLAQAVRPDPLPRQRRRHPARALLLRPEGGEREDGQRLHARTDAD